MLKKDVIWSWETRHKNSLNTLKEQISKAPVLSQFDPTQNITIQCDASKNGLGCCIVQNKKLSAFAFRSMTNAEVMYSQIEKELLSLIFACRKFKNFIWGSSDRSSTLDKFDEKRNN